MSRKTEVIRRQMEGTREALAEKLERLETQVVEKVQETTASVAHTAESVSETVDAVKKNLDLNWHAQRHPWAPGGSHVPGLRGCSPTFEVRAPA